MKVILEALQNLDGRDVGDHEEGAAVSLEKKG